MATTEDTEMYVSPCTTSLIL